MELSVHRSCVSVQMPLEATVSLNVIYLEKELRSSRKARVVQRRDGSRAWCPNKSTSWGPGFEEQPSTFVLLLCLLTMLLWPQKNHRHRCLVGSWWQLNWDTVNISFMDTRFCLLKQEEDSYFTPGYYPVHFYLFLTYKMDTCKYSVCVCVCARVRDYVNIRYVPCVYC